MKFNRYYLVLEFFIILLYLLMNLFSIIIFPINIILGFICILFLPGYNLLKLIRPNSNLIEKLGYSTFFSLAIENILMFIIYFSFFNYVQKSGRYAFIFWHELLILIIQIISIFLILLNIFLNKSQKKSNKIIKYFKGIKKNINQKDLLIITGLLVSLIFLCISVFFNEVKYDNFSTVKKDYLLNFTFFSRVPLIFYIFLTSSIIFLVYILFQVKNKYLMLFSMSIFLYCLWILPYLQIKGVVASDMDFLKTIYENYLIFGINSNEVGCFIILFRTFKSIRYSTSLFTSILLTFGMKSDVDFALVFLYPLIFIFIPFFFYSIFQKFSKSKNENEISLRILMLLVIITTSIIKNVRTPTTAIIGSITFIILIIEFFKFINDDNRKLREIFLFIFLYFFLTLTHLEECVYFLLLMPLYTIYFILFKLKDNSDNREIIKSLKRFFLIIGLLYLILSTIFITLQEFFGSTIYYFGKFRDIPYISIIFDMYWSTRVVLYPLMEGCLSISLFLLGITIIGISGSIIILYLFFSSFFHILIKIYNKLIGIISKIHSFLSKLISVKIIQIAIPFLLFSMIIGIDFIFPYLEMEGFLIIIEVVLSYSIIVFNVFLFIKGVPYYRTHKNKQDYFLILMVILFVFMIFLGIGDLLLAWYHFNSRIITFSIFYNLMIIQNTYFDDFISKKNKYLVILVFLLLGFGTFYSLRKLGFG